MQLIFVRHGKPDVDAPGDPSDPRLSAEGAAQAHTTARVLVRQRVAAIYSSPARRAVETARVLSLCVQLDVETLPELAEFNAGSGEYVDVDELRRRKDPRWDVLQRGELYDCDKTAAELRRTISGTADSIIRRHPGGTAVVFTHAGVVNLYIGSLLGISQPIWTAPAHASISRVLADRRGRRTVLSVNESAHLTLTPPRLV